MYEQHFGLQRQPFTARATGADVFVGPQTAATMAGLKKALQSQDAVIAVCGPAGAGKSTLVGKALDAVANTHRSVRIGRMSLDGADALEFLLEELGVTDLPRGTIRQFAALREKLGQLEKEGKRLVIVVEDAVLTGADTMAEFEALTAADAGESGGAAIVVMGDERLGEFLKDRQLARLVQRIRQRHDIQPLSPAELRGYLAHSFRRAGKEFESIFDADAAVIIHDLCNGNPRIANNLVDAVLAAAAASGRSPVSGKFIADVGSNQLGLVATRKIPAEPAPAANPTPVVEAAPEPEEVGETAPEPARADAPVSDAAAPTEAPAEVAPPPEPEPAQDQDPIIVFSDEPRDESDDDDIPELIQDTLPDLAILAPEVIEREAASDPSAAGESQPPPDPEPLPELVPEPEPVLEVEVEPEPVLEVVPEPVLEAEPEPVPEARPQPPLEPEAAEPAAFAESAASDIPEWERDPTMAELRPDLEALEKAMAFAQGDDGEEEPPVLEPLPESKPEPPVAEIEEIPEITLDNAIQQRIESGLIDEPGSVSAGGEAPPSTKSGGVPDVRIPARNAKKADQELERIAAELAKAKTIEDVDDKLAETLFGEEFNLVAAQVVANGPDEASANDGELELCDTGSASVDQAPGIPVIDGVPVVDTPAVEVSLDSKNDGADTGPDLSVSQRLKTVRALNAEKNASPQERGNGHDRGADTPERNVANPEPIEDQINISMTQTLEALNVRPPVLARDDDDAPDDDEEEKKGGFFSRFRRS